MINLIKPKSLSVITVSVNYGPILSTTLPHNRDLFDDFVVVTTEEDKFTQDVAREFGAKLVISNRCYEHNDSFNKGKLLNDGISSLENPDWILLTDADILINKEIRKIRNMRMDRNCLYFTHRVDLHEVKNQDPAVNTEPNGFFQLFHPEAEPVRSRWPKPMCENFCSAGGVDTWFYMQWVLENIVEMDDIPVKHIPSRFFGENWNGLNPVSGRWIQIGFLDYRGILTFDELSFRPKVVRLTDLIYGESIEIPLDKVDDHVKILGEDLEFLGRRLYNTPIHVACKAP